MYSFSHYYSALKVGLGRNQSLCHVTGMALAHCILGKFLGVVCHCFPLPLDVPTLAARYIHPQRHERY